MRPYYRSLGMKNAATAVLALLFVPLVTSTHASSDGCKPIQSTLGALTAASKNTGLFQSLEPLKLSLEASFEELSTKGKGLASLGMRDESIFPAVVSLENGGTRLNLNAQLRPRGMSSLSFLPFPKLKMKITDPVKGTPFEGARNLAINTHGFEKDMGPGVAPFGRLASPVVVNREAAVYDLLSELGIPTRQSRRAEITYKYTDTNRSTTQPALLIEDMDQAAKRLGGKELKLLMEYKGDINERVNKDTIARLGLAEMLIGNSDWGFPTVKAQGLIHNIGIVELPNGKWIPLMEDFDQSRMVSGLPQRIDQMSPRFFPGKDELFREMAWEIQRLRHRLGKKTIADSVAFMNEKKDQLLARIDKLLVDPEGKKNIRRHLDAFYEALKPDNLNIPLMTKSQVPVYSGPDAKLKVAETLEDGLPVRILETRGDMSLVEFGSVLVRGEDGANGFEKGWVRTSSIGR